MKTPERIAAEALILGADLVHNVEGVLAGLNSVKCWHCPYCGTTSTTQEEAHTHDGVCESHPMALQVAELRKDKARLDWLETHLIDSAYPFVAIETYPTKCRVVNVTATREEDSADFTGKTIRAAIDAAMEAK